MEDQVENQEVVETPVETPQEFPDVMSMSDEEFLAYEESGSDMVQEEAPTEESVGEEEVLDETEANVSEEDENPSEELTDSTEEDIVEFSKEEAYDEIMGEFKANGKMMKVESVDEARKLMQMGANYHKKMNSIKEDQKFIRVLKDNGLLDQGKLNHLIDLSKNDPAAIKELLKSSGTDPLDMDMNEDSEYTPNSYEVNEAQVQLDNVLEELQSSDSYATTMDIISNKWDSASRVAMASQPDDIAVLNSQVESGIYQKVIEAVDKQRMLGQLDGVSDFEAYKKVGSELHASGQLANGTKQPVEIDVERSTPNVNVKRKAAAPTKSQAISKPSTQKITKNPLEMSDAEYEAVFGKA